MPILYLSLKTNVEGDGHALPIVRGEEQQLSCTISQDLQHNMIDPFELGIM